MSENGTPEPGTESSVLRRPGDPDAGGLHDMGGNIGPARMTASSDRREQEHGAQVAHAAGGATSPADAGTPLAASSTPPESPSEAGDQDTAEATPQSRPEYEDLGGGAVVGRGADGDTAAREQLEATGDQ